MRLKRQFWRYWQYLVIVVILVILDPIRVASKKTTKKPPPTLVSPANETITRATTVNFSWRSPKRSIKKFWLYVADPTELTPRVNQPVNGLNFTTNLRPDIYRWRVGYTIGKGQALRYIWSEERKLAIISDIGRTSSVPFRANTHAHSSVSNDWVGQHGNLDPFEFLAHIRCESDDQADSRCFNAWFLTEHGGKVAGSNNEWRRLQQVTGLFSDGQFVALPGFESQTDKGHINVIGSQESPSAQTMERLDSIYNWLAEYGDQSIYGDSVVCQFNHPQTDEFDSFAFPTSQPTLDRYFTLLAVLSRADVGSIGFKSRETAYQKALRAGWHVGATGEIDNHLSIFGHTHSPSTGIWADGLTQTSIFEALKNRRTFACENGFDSVDVVVVDENNQVVGRMGDRGLRFRPGLKLRVLYNSANPLTQVMMVRGAVGVDEVEQLVKTKPLLDPIEFDLVGFGWPKDEVISRETWYYFRLENTNPLSNVIFTSPIWFNPPTTGQLAIASRPAGATVVFDNEPLNILTPTLLADLVPGTYSVGLRLPGYYDWPGPLGTWAGVNGLTTVEIGKTSSLNVNLVPDNVMFPIEVIRLTELYNSSVTYPKPAYYLLVGKKDVSYRITLVPTQGQANLALMYTNGGQSETSPGVKVIEFTSLGNIDGGSTSGFPIIIWAAQGSTSNFTLYVTEMQPRFSRTKRLVSKPAYPAHGLVLAVSATPTQRKQSGLLDHRRQVVVGNPAQLTLGVARDGYVYTLGIALYTLAVEPGDYRLRVSFEKNVLGGAIALFYNQVFETHDYGVVDLYFQSAGRGTLPILVRQSTSGDSGFAVIANRD